MWALSAPCSFSTSNQKKKKITKFSVLRRLSQSHGSPNTTGTTTTTTTNTTPWVLVWVGRVGSGPNPTQGGPRRRKLDFFLWLFAETTGQGIFPRADDGQEHFIPRTADYYFLSSLGMGWKPGCGLLYQVSCLDNERRPSLLMVRTLKPPPAHSYQCVHRI